MDLVDGSQTVNVDVDVYTKQLEQDIRVMTTEIKEFKTEYIQRTDNLFAGMQIIMYILVGFFVWKVITIVHRLFGGIFFGGI